MNTRDLIIRLIQQDMKHNQLLAGLHHINLSTAGLYSLNIIGIVADLIDIKIDSSHPCVKMYNTYLERAHRFKVIEDGANLLPIARECYECLLICFELGKAPKELSME